MDILDLKENIAYLVTLAYIVKLALNLLNAILAPLECLSTLMVIVVTVVNKGII